MGYGSLERRLKREIIIIKQFIIKVNKDFTEQNYCSPYDYKVRALFFGHLMRVTPT